jgi:hypothetical protein
LENIETDIRVYARSPGSRRDRALLSLTSVTNRAGRGRTTGSLVVLLSFPEPVPREEFAEELAQAEPLGRLVEVGVEGAGILERNVSRWNGHEMSLLGLGSGKMGSMTRSSPATGTGASRRSGPSP